MRLLTWNVLADVHFTRSAWYPDVDPADVVPAVRRRRVLETLAAADADVLALQEVEPGLFDELRAWFPEYGAWHAPYRGEGLALLSRLPVAEVAEVPFPAGRCGLWMRLADGLAIATVHLSWSGDPSPGAGRAGVAQLAAVLERRPDAVCGDLNAFPDWPERRFAIDAGWIDGTPEGATCNVQRRLQPLDAVLHRQGLRFDAEPLPRIAGDTPMPSAVFASDHLPVVGDLVGAVLRATPWPLGLPRGAHTRRACHNRAPCP